MLALTSALFLQSAAGDTVLARVVATELTTLQKVLAVAEIGLIVLAYALLVGMLLAILRIAKAIEGAKDKLDEVSTDVRKVIETGNRVIEKANGIVASVKSTVDDVHETVEYTNKRAQQAVGDLADTVDDFNRTLTVMQSETQGVVVAALSAMRGVSAGVKALKRRPGRKKADEDRNGDERVEAGARPRLKRRVHVDA